VCLVTVNLDAKHGMPLSAGFRDLPQHGLRLPCSGPNENYCSFGSGDAGSAVRFPFLIKRLMNGPVVELDIVVLVMSMFDKEVPSGLSNLI
jgi:hypothetical protein